MLSLSKHRVPVQGRFDKLSDRSPSTASPYSSAAAKTFFTFFAKNLDKTFPVRYGE
jgi:hypothetical protein